MKNLFFIRSVTGTHSWEYYESKPEAIVFGDVEGYRYFADVLEIAKSATSNIHLNEIDTSSNSMQVVIVPARKTEKEEAQIRIIERPVFVNQSANMELVVFGNSSGYQHLIALFSKAMAETKDDPDNHFHLDDAENNCLIKRSVSLNIRCPLAQWSKKKLGHWADMVFERQPTFLPQDIEYLFKDPEPYREIEPEISSGVITS